MEILILYSKCIAALLAGLIISTLQKHNEESALFEKGNVGELSLKQFLMKKPTTHIINWMAGLMWLLVLPDFIKAHPTVYGSEFYANILHIVVCSIWGWANSLLLMKVLGTGTKYGLDIIDKKTNIADGK